MNLSNNQLVIIVVISIFFIIFNYYTNNFIEELTNAEEGQQMLSKITKQEEEREKSLKNYSNKDNYNIRYHLTEKTLRRKFPVLLKEDNISFQKDGKPQEIKRLPAQNRATFFEPGEKHFISNYVPNYEEQIVLSKKRNELNFNEIDSI